MMELESSMETVQLLIASGRTGRREKQDDPRGDSERYIPRYKGDKQRSVIVDLFIRSVMIPTKEMQREDYERRRQLDRRKVDAPVR